jgi:hypothetical protein
MCQSGQYFCRKEGDNTDYCSDPSVTLTSGFPGMPVTAVTKLVMSGTTSTESSGSTSTATRSSSASESTTSCVSKNQDIVAVGAGVGVSLGVLFLCSLLALFVMWRSQRKLKGQLRAIGGGNDHIRLMHCASPFVAPEKRSNLAPEADGSSGPTELHHESQVFVPELAGTLR